MRVLIVDDEPHIRSMLKLALENEGCQVTTAAALSTARALLRKESFDVAFVDHRLRSESGLALLEEGAGVRTAVVVMTAYATIEGAVTAMRAGAFDYLPKPFKPDDVRLALGRAERVRGLERKVEQLEGRLACEVPATERGNDPRALEIEGQARQVAATDAAVLIRGESGVGKGVLARAIHDWSKRARGPFVTVSCPSLSRELLESSLFGHARGSFTGAVTDVEGKVAAAEGGTLFLDEIGDLPLELQPKLLRFLQDKQYERLGETCVRTADVRLIAATNQDLERAVADDRFRQDLYFRISVVELAPPPLRSRTDLLAIAGRLAAFFAHQLGKSLSGFSPEAEAAMQAYSWPGNLRELRNAIERAAIFAAGNRLELHDLPERITRAQPLAPAAPANTLSRLCTLQELEAEHIRRVLEAAPSLEQAAAILGVDPSTLYRKRRQFGL